MKIDEASINHNIVRTVREAVNRFTGDAESATEVVNELIGALDLADKLLAVLRA